MYKWKINKGKENRQVLFASNVYTVFDIGSLDGTILDAGCCDEV